MASVTTDIGSFQLQGGGTPIVWASDTIKTRLVLATATPSRASTSMTGLTGTGTDQTMGSKTLTNDTVNHRTVYDAADAQWLAVPAGPDIGWLVTYKDGVNDAARIPIFVTDIAEVTPNGSNIDWPISADGIGYTQQ